MVLAGKCSLMSAKPGLLVEYCRTDDSDSVIAENREGWLFDN